MIRSVIAHYRQRTNPRALMRAAYARTSGDLLVNDPAGFPSAYPPVPWAGGGTVDGQGPPIWWVGVDSGGGADPIGPNGPWPRGDGRNLPAVTRATALITGPLTASPFTLSDTAEPGRELPAPRWLTDPMLLRPDDRIHGTPFPAVHRLARSIFWADWIRSAIWFGEGAFIAIEDQTGQPVAGSLRLLNPLVLDTERDSNGSLVWAINLTNDGDPPAVFDRNGYLTLGPVRYRITVLRNPHSPVSPEGRSLGVFAMNPSAFRLGHQIENYTSGTFRSGIPAGYLKVNSPDMSQDKASKLKRDWLNAHGGDRRSIAVLNAVTDFVPLNLSPVDSELAEVERLNIAEVAYAFGLDPTTLGVSLTGSMTYTNVRDTWINHRDFGLSPWIGAVQDTLSAWQPSSQTVRVDLDGFANPTRAERYAALQTGINAGIITIDEAREAEGLPPLPPSAKPAPVPTQFQTDDTESTDDSADDDAEGAAA